MRKMTLSGLMRRSALGATVVVALVLPATALGQATRTWVSGVGDDANPCSRTAPCKTFAGAISKTAPAGEIDVLDPGGFGAVTITKSITIRSNSIEAGVLVSGTNGIIVSAAPTDRVRLIGLNFDGLNTGLSGIQILSAKSVLVEDCDINEFTGAGINFVPAPSTPNTPQLIVENTRIDGQVANTGVSVNPGTNGDGAKATIRDSSIDDNTNGLVVNGPSRVASATLVRSDVSDNSATGILSVGGQATVNLGESSVTNNATALAELTGGMILSAGDNFFAGNGANGAPTGSLSKL